jgi:hypothetical protein
MVTAITGIIRAAYKAVQESPKATALLAAGAAVVALVAKRVFDRQEKTLSPSPSVSGGSALDRSIEAAAAVPAKGDTSPEKTFFSGLNRKERLAKLLDLEREDREKRMFTNLPRPTVMDPTAQEEKPEPPVSLANAGVLHVDYSL